MAETSEAVALELLKAIAFAENKALFKGDAGTKPGSRWIMDTYAECLRLTRGAASERANLALVPKGG